MKTKVFGCIIPVLCWAISYTQSEIDPDRIVAIWLLDESKGDVAEDASENGLHGKITQGKWESRGPHG